MPTFHANYPHYQHGQVSLLPTPERLGALPQYTGRGVVIAFVDAGFHMHPDIRDRVLVHVDASTQHVIEQPSVEEISDLSWHGQMTSVIAAGDGRTSGGLYRGIASDAHLVLIKVSSPRGQVKEADILRGLQWLNNAHRRFNVRIVNISVGGDFESQDPQHPLHRMVRKLVEAGVAVVTASGNKNAPILVPPASTPAAITVGGYSDHNSLDWWHRTPYHHDFGCAYDGTRKPEVVTAAEWIASPILPGSLVDRQARWLAPLLNGDTEGALRRLLEHGYMDLGLSLHEVQSPNEHLYGMLQGRINGYKLIDAAHQHVDGTSVSAAIASSIIAQMLEANPRLTPAGIRAILTQTAAPLPGVALERQGAGAINAARAVQAAANWRH
jgi:serine protease AprX